MLYKKYSYNKKVVLFVDVLLKKKKATRMDSFNL